MNNNIVYSDSLSNKDQNHIFNILYDNAYEKLGLNSDNNGSFSFTIKDNDDNLKAAIEGFSYYGCCYIDLLAVVKEHRGKGYATQLINKTHELAKNRNCLFMVVGTMDFEAKPFYEKLGFEVEFIRNGFEKESKMYFLRKEL